MVAFQIEDIKTFTQKLFLGSDFDEFLVKEVNIATFNRFTIDGRVCQGFYSAEEREQLQPEEFSTWKLLRPVCFSLIKGKKLPGSFRIDLQMAPGAAEKFLENCRIPSMDSQQIKGLHLQIRYEDGKLACITGTSLAFFTLDKTIETEWDEFVGQLLKEKGIAAMRH